MSERKEVGAFLYEDGQLYGPKAYMEEQGNERLERILAGQDAVFNMSAHYSPDAITAVLVCMQTDYAGWKGVREFFGGRR